jgi:hypothetical protein
MITSLLYLLLALEVEFWLLGRGVLVRPSLQGLIISQFLFFSEQEGRNWWLTGVYGPQGDDEKVLFLQELRNIRALCNGPWLVACDFNLIYQVANKNNANLDRAMMGRFRCFLDDNDLLEIPLLGRKYTWSNERRSPTLVSLDRAFCCDG